MDGIQYFTGLTTVKITGNAVKKLDITAFTELETLEMNNNCVTEMDFTANTKLKRLRCGQTVSAPVGDKLAKVTFGVNHVIEHIYLKNQNLTEFTLPQGCEALKELDLSGNPGAPFSIPANIFDQLTTALGVQAAGDTPVTPDPDPEPEPTDEYYTLPDAAFGEYLYYLSTTDGVSNALPAGLIVKEGEAYKLDRKIAATVTKVNVAKTSSTIKKLTEAGLATAETLISNADGLQFFTELTEFTATSNKFAEPLPLTALTKLEVLQVNTAGVASLDLSACTKLRVLNCNGSSKSGYGKLTTIDLSHNSLLETLNLKNNELTAIDVSNLTKLTELDLSGNPGADFTIPAAIYDNLKNTKDKGVKK